MVKIKELADIYTEGNLLDLACMIADKVIDDYMANVEEHSYFIFKRKMMLTVDLLEKMLTYNSENINLDDLLNNIEKEIKRIKKEIFDDWKNGKLYKDRRVNEDSLKFYQDKTYVKLVKSLPCYYSKKNEEIVRNILNYND